ncbi:helix-turn-helix domain-containing protein [Streptomyces sp. NPDC006638]|uniref:ArsR/SmtB family transcription factor n=1 Tax=Streptomyces sp. NPDC006638 TaxID=3157183 RepID=UPI0033A4D0EA
MPEASRPSPRDDVHALDPHTLRGLAHPIRMRLLAALRHHGPATASQLAERLGESSGATSYHLRQLAAYGFVEDAPELGKGRERWWKAARQGTSFDRSLYTDSDPSTRTAVEVFLEELADSHAREVSTWVHSATDWPVEWHGSANLSDYTLRLTPELAAEMNAEAHALIESYRDRAIPEDAENVAQVRVHLHALPQTED